MREAVALAYTWKHVNSMSSLAIREVFLFAVVRMTGNRVKHKSQTLALLVYLKIQHAQLNSIPLAEIEF